MKIIWGIPKNLVYILFFVIVGAFLFMAWSTYTQRNMKEVFEYSSKKEVTVVNPLFAELRA